MRRALIVLAFAACAAVATSSPTAARLTDLTTETRQAQPNYAQYYYGPYRRHVRRVYRRSYRRAYYGGYYGGYSPYYYGGEDTIAPIIVALIVDMCDEFTVEPTDEVITDASLERPPGRAPGIGEPPALACSQELSTANPPSGEPD